ISSRITRWCSPSAMTSEALRHASMAIACDSSMSSDSQVNPSPRANQSTPSWRAIFSSPTFQSPDLRNWTTATFQPRARARSIVPKAAVDLPLPSPVLTMIREGARRVAGGGGSVGGSWTGSVIRSRMDEAERMPRRVDVHPPGRSRSVVGLASAQLQHSPLGGLDVVDDEIEVRLLGVRRVGPLGRDVVGGQLAGDGRSRVRSQLDPVDVVVGLDLPAGDRRIELGEPHGIGGVEGDYREAGDAHGTSSVAVSSTGSPTSTRPSARTRAYTRDQPGWRPWCIRMKSPPMNHWAFLLQGVVNEVTSSSASPARRRVPGTTVDHSMPAMVRFSPAEPGWMGCPSAWRASITSSE